MSKIKYTLSGGQAVEVEVNAEIAEMLADFEREDENAARKYRWRNEVSIDALKEKTGWEPTDNTVDIETDYIVKEEKETLLAAVARLTEKQQRLIQLYYYEEKTSTEIAAMQGVDPSAIRHQLKTVREKLKKLL